MAVNQVLNLYAIKHLGAILGVLARADVLGVVGPGIWHPDVCRGMIVWSSRHEQR